VKTDTGNEILAFHMERSGQPLFCTLSASSFSSNGFHCGNRKTIQDKGCFFASTGDILAVVCDWTRRRDSDTVI